MTSRYERLEQRLIGLALQSSGEEAYAMLMQAAATYALAEQTRLTRVHTERTSRTAIGQDPDGTR